MPSGVNEKAHEYSANKQTKIYGIKISQWEAGAGVGNEHRKSPSRAHGQAPKQTSHEVRWGGCESYLPFAQHRALPLGPTHGPAIDWAIDLPALHCPELCRTEQMMHAQTGVGLSEVPCKILSTVPDTYRAAGTGIFF